MILASAKAGAVLAWRDLEARHENLTEIGLRTQPRKTCNLLLFAFGFLKKGTGVTKPCIRYEFPKSNPVSSLKRRNRLRLLIAI